MVTVRALMEALKDCNPNDIVILSKDGEGNEYSPLADEMGDGVYVPQSTWSGEVHLRALTPALEKQGFTAADVWDVGDQGAVNCITLWPIN